MPTNAAGCAGQSPRKHRERVKPPNEGQHRTIQASGPALEMV